MMFPIQPTQVPQVQPQPTPHEDQPAQPKFGVRLQFEHPEPELPELDDNTGDVEIDWPEAS